MSLEISSVCTKHPGFHEEREWRIVYNPTKKPSDRMKREIRSINGLPQPIIRMPLADDPANGLVGADIPKLINRVIIGPSKHPYELEATFVELLTKARVPNAENIVFVSNTPLRV